MNLFRIKLGLFAAAMLVATLSPAQTERETPNKTQEQIGLTRNPNAHGRDAVFDEVQGRQEVRERQETQMDEGTQRQVERTARSLTRRFLDQWKRYDELKKKIEDERKKPRNQRDREKLREWEKELDDVKKENKTQRDNFNITSDEVKDKVRDQVNTEKRQEAQNAENKKAKAEGREPQTITSPPMPYGNPPVLD